MPLNPNGKIDKPALPFPDTAVAAGGSSKTKARDGTVAMSPAEATIHDIWSRLLPSAPAPISLDESFFDLGGHSILATRLIFEIRNALAVPAPLGIVFEHPTIRGLAAEVQRQSQDDFGLASGSGAPDLARKEHALVAAFDYAADADALSVQLAARYDAPAMSTDGLRTVFLTGATGFLGAFLLRDLLQRVNEVARVVCLVRGRDAANALERLRSSGVDRGAWDEGWVESGRLSAVVGDLESSHFGLDDGTWRRMADEADMVVHNGALVRFAHSRHGRGKLS
jgi:L-aminoadipate-semialdehyde dehydrogenase